MKIKSLCLFLILMLGITSISNAQKILSGNNIVKLNLAGLPFKNFSAQYERILTKRVSIALSLRTMPSSKIPFRNEILNYADITDPNVKETIEKFEISNFAITPEVRFYLLGKGYGKGFYIAPFFRQAGFKTNNMIFTYDDILNNQHSISLSGKLSSSTVGALLGIQKTLGKYICLDLWIVGPHYGKGTGTFTGLSSQPLTQNEQNQLKQQLDDIDIPFTDKKTTVTANGMSVRLDGPWAGIRTGLCIGIKF